MIQHIKDLKVYLIAALLIIGYYAYAAVNGVAYWESSDVTKDTQYNNNTRVRGIHAFYHK